MCGSADAPSPENLASADVQPVPPRRATRRALLTGLAATATATAAVQWAGPQAMAAPVRPAALSDAPLSLTLLGTNGGPPPLATRYGISSALVVNGRTYVVDCGRGAVSQYLRAGLSMPSLAGIFLTHLHADHTVDYFAFPLLSAGASGQSGFRSPIDVYGPGPAGIDSTVALAPGPVAGTVRMTELAAQAYAASPTFFMSEHTGSDPTALLRVHDVLPPAATGASATNTAPTMTPFTVMENDDMRVTAVLVPHGAVFPAYAYRFDTDHGSVVFSGDTSPTPNLIALARHADVLVHEALYPDGLAGEGLPQSLVDHILASHTDVGELGRIAAESDVVTLVATHLGPGDPATVSDATWRRLLKGSARRAAFGGSMVLGSDLLHLPVRHGRSR
ncbi:MBL fold metallo-hydrolase [Streptomyces sp. NBC_01361]|uniref:MBL fold metallo-hydrolase n=1 Tax=Streptomyces sp. NBC_01361 TaxID=2903838 RepID=UPI002E2F37F2|nr:MBL fold metallo-hydrolase [Streptomyces sp. NBC_01361]